MPGQNSDDIVEMLRKKTRDADLEQALKSRLGGYSKQSVLDYLSLLKKQRQDTAETFRHNLQTLFEEKESLKTKNEELQAKQKKLEAEYRNLSEAMATYQLENKDYTVQDIVKLKGTIASLEAGAAKADAEKRGLEKRNEQLRQTVEEKERAVTASQQGVQLQKDLLLQEKLENKKQREQVSQLSESVEELRSEIQYLKGRLTEEKVAELDARIKTLLENAAAQEDVLKETRRQLAEKESAVRTSAGECESLGRANDQLKAYSDQVMEQNEKLAAANRGLSARLGETHRQLVELIEKKSDETVEKLIANRKLDSANLKISMLEMERRKYRRAEETAAAASAAEPEAAPPAAPSPASR